jgi:hypothetical protein
MDFPPLWDVFSHDDFELASPRDPGELGVELMVQARANGRMLDHHKLTLGGSLLLEAVFPVKVIMPAFNTSNSPAWKIKYAVWPRDVKLRRNMSTSYWTDMREIISANDARVLGEQDEAVDSKVYLDYVDQLQDKSLSTFSVRWAVCASEDGTMQLQLQALPAAASSFSGKPAFKG